MHARLDAGAPNSRTMLVHLLLKSSMLVHLALVDLLLESSRKRVRTRERERKKDRDSERLRVGGGRRLFSLLYHSQA